MSFHDEGCISIIIPVYNVHKYLRECLDSVLCQSNQGLSSARNAELDVAYGEFIGFSQKGGL